MKANLANNESYFYRVFFKLKKLIKLFFLILLFFLGNSHSIKAQPPDNLGTEFWLMFNQNIGGAGTQTLFISSAVATNGVVDIPGIGFNQAFSVTPGSVTSVVLPTNVDVTTSDVIENKGIHITSDDEIAVYGLNQRSATTDAFLGIPLDVYDTDYIVLGYRSLNSSLGSQFGIIATVDGTIVTITPSETVGSRIAGVPYDITMNQGDTYQLETDGDPEDLSGTIITSTEPIGVYGGADCTNVPTGVFACDHLVEQMPPTSTWGTQFLTIPLATRTGGDIFRVIASEDNTDITLNGVVVATLNQGDFHEMDLASTSYNELTATSPVLLAQYSKGTTSDGVTSDPFMMLIPPFEQFSGAATFSTPSSGFSGHYVNIVIQDAGVGSVQVDGITVPAGDFTPIGTSGFSGVQVEISAGVHTVFDPNGNLFGSFVYGFGFADSYGYPSGQLYSPAALASSLTIDPVDGGTCEVGTEYCVTATVLDQNGMPLENIRVDFEISGANNIVNFVFTDANGEAEFCYTGLNPGVDMIEASVGNLNATGTKTWVCPDVNFTALADLCVDAGVQTGLSGGTPSGGVYSGPGVTDDGNGMTYSFDPAAAGVGVHTLMYTEGVCIATDDVEVYALPTVTFNIPAAQDTFCIDDGVQTIAGGNPPGGVYSGPGVTDNANGTDFDFDPAAAGLGLHILTYTYTDANGCTNDDTDFISVEPLPTVNFTALADLCLDAGVQAGLGGGTPTGGVYSGPGVTDDGNGMTYSFDPAAAGVGMHTLTYTYTNFSGCTNSASDDVEVFDLPVVMFTAPAPDVCVQDPPVTGLGGGTPTGGVYSGPGVTDDANGTTFSFDPTASAPTGGNIPVTYTFTDANGCSASAMDDIFVNPVCCMLEVTCPTANDLGTFDCNNPVPPLPVDSTDAASPPYNIVFGTDPCGTILVEAADDMTIDQCGTMNQMVTRTVFIWDDLPGGTPGVFDPGTEESATCTFTFTYVPDTTPPVAPNPPGPVTVQCATDIPPPMDLTASDACSGDITVSPTAVIDPGACANRFTMTRTWTFTDACGNPSSVSQVITVFDDTAPVLSAMPASTIVECDGIPSAPEITATDNCAVIPPVLFVNEIHYDNTGSDVGEFLEIAGTAGVDLANYEVYAYENFDGQFDAQIALSGIIPDEGAGFGAVAFTRTELPSGFFENGPAEGIALVEIASGEVVKFISYEGTVTATNGPAAGLTSTDIGVLEPFNTPVGQSLQLTGLNGCPCTDFSWNPPAPDSPGLINAGQSFDQNACPSSNEVPVTFTESITPGSCANEQTINRTWTAMDLCGNVASHTQTITVEDNTAPVFCDPPADLTLTCELPGDAEITAIDNCGATGNRIAWINEIHYDNTGGDVGEFIEIAGIAGTDLSGFQLLAYDSDDLLDAQVTLSGVLPDESCGYGTLAFFLGDLNSQFFENGPEEGRALMQTGVGVIDFISYEGVVNAMDGPAAGMSSVDIGVSEPFNTPVGESLQLTGSGFSGSSFTWTGPLTDSPGSLNAGQVIGTAPDITVVLDETGTANICEGGTITRTWTATDACGNTGTPHTQVITILPAPGPMIVCPPDITVSCEDEIMLDPNNAIATPGCPGTSIVATYIKNPLASGAPGCDGTVYTYIYVTVDDCGRSAECEQQVLIVNTPATITVPAGGTVECFEDINLSIDDATVENACADYEFYLTTPELNGEQGCPGTTYTYTYRVVDVCGNTIEEDVVFTNGSNANPTIVAPAGFTVDCLGTGPNPDAAIVTTSCGTGFEVTVSDPVISGPLDCSGTTYTYTYTVTDKCGRTAMDTQVLTVSNEAPVFTNCPDNNWQQFNCEDYGGEDGTIAVIEAWIGTVTASSSCGTPITVTNDFNPNNINTCINNGIMEIDFKATDACGRTTTCTGTIVVVDTEAPMIIEEAQDHYEMCNFNTQANLDAWVANLAGAEAIDGCSGDNVSWTVSPGNPQINCLGSSNTTSVEVTFIVTDNCGNKTSTTATFNALPAPGFNESGQSTQLNGEGGISLFQNQPNPWKDETQIGFYLPVEMEATLVIYDITGRELKRIRGDYAQGFNVVSIARGELSAKGVLLYQLQTELGSVTKRMIITE